MSTRRHRPEQAIIQFPYNAEMAVDQKMEDQTEFVRWWDENVRRPGGQLNNSDRNYSVDEATKLTGITQQQVSKWRRRLQDPEAYRAMLFGVAYAKAMAKVNNTTAVNDPRLSNGHNYALLPPSYTAAYTELEAA